MKLWHSSFIDSYQKPLIKNKQFWWTGRVTCPACPPLLNLAPLQLQKSVYKLSYNCTLCVELHTRKTKRDDL